jgi:cell division transport system permease protein
MFSNGLTIVSNGLIFFLLALVISGFIITEHMVEILESEAEVAVYSKMEIQEEATWIEELRKINGVRDVRLVSEEEAYERMSAILGEEAQVLQYFQENPFSAFIELSIDLQNMETVLDTLEIMPEISSIRDNRDVLGKLRDIVKGITFMSVLILIAVGMTTLVVLSHTIRQSIYHYREQITTLTLLGAPMRFIAIPFYILGIWMSFVSGIIATMGAFFVIQSSYGFMMGPIPFIPLPPMTETIQVVAIYILSLSVIFGILGCMLGMVSVKKQ